jgi:thiamine-monophosphate kinase
LSVTLQLHGFVPAGQILRRAGARPGDLLYLSGPVGEAGLALWCRQHKVTLPQPYGRLLMESLDLPVPAIELGISLRGLASSAVDISDGLLADLGHICSASQIGAIINVSDLPRSPAFHACAQALLEQKLISEKELLSIQLSGGDDYKLCFTVPASYELELVRQSECCCIGVIDEAEDIRCRDKQGYVEIPNHPGFDHFA